MKIQPMGSEGRTVGSITADTGAAGQSAVQKMRSIRMNTDATPLQAEIPPPAPETAAPAAEITIPDGSNTEAKPATEENQPLSPQLAAIARQRRSLQAKEREIADREKALVDRVNSSEVVELNKLKSNPLGVLRDAGVSYDQLAQAVIDDQNGVSPELRAMREDIKGLKDEFNKTLTEKDAQNEQQVLRQIKSDGARLLEAGDDFVLVRENGMLPKVMEFIERQWREKQDLVDIKDALGHFESILRKRHQTASEKLGKALNPPAAQTETAPIEPPPQQQRRQTLTNRDTASPVLDKKARAMRKFWNQQI